MFRQFWLRMQNVDFFGDRASSDLMFNVFRDAPQLRAMTRFVLPALQTLPTDGPASAAATQVDAPAATALSLPESAPTAESRSDAVPLFTGVFPIPSGDGVTLESGIGVAFMSAPISLRAADGAAASGGAATQFQILYSDDLGTGLVIDPATRQILTGAAENVELGAGDGDVLVLAGPLSNGALPQGLRGLESVVVQAGSSYDLTSSDDHVARGETLEVNGAPLGPGDSIAFDGSAETDGNFIFIGGAGSDSFLGGAGDDRIFGGAGGDSLRGGDGADTYFYGSAGEASGAGYDSLLDFDAGEDAIDLPVAVTGFDADVTSGALSTSSFDADLGAATSGLGAGHALLFAPDSGDLAGTIFLVVDGNGEAGYQAGEDFVFALPGAALTDLSGHTDIFV